MELIADILSSAPSLLSSDGTREIWMEVDCSHPSAIKGHCCGNKHRYELIEDRNDLSGNPRFVKLIARKA